MRAHTEGKNEMGRRFAIVIGVAAAGVMALGAQTALAGGEPVDSVKPDLKLSGPKRQDPQNDLSFCDRGWCNVKVKASCGDEACTARAEGKLTNVKSDKLTTDFPTDIAPGEKKQLYMDDLTDQQRKQVRKALDDGKKVRAKVTARATDAAGNVATAKRTIRLGARTPGRNGRAGPRESAAAPDVVKHDTTLSITTGPYFPSYHGGVESEVRECMEGRRVVVFKKRPGADRKIGTRRSYFSPSPGEGGLWYLRQGQGPEKNRARVYAKVTPKVGDGFVCRADRSPTI